MIKNKSFIKIKKYGKIFYRKKKRGPTEIRTRINGFKVQCANRYTIGPINILIFFLFIIHNILKYNLLRYSKLGSN